MGFFAIYVCKSSPSLKQKDRKKEKNTINIIWLETTVSNLPLYNLNCCGLFWCCPPPPPPPRGHRTRGDARAFSTITLKHMRVNNPRCSGREGGRKKENDKERKRKKEKEGKQDRERKGFYIGSIDIMRRKKWEREKRRIEGGGERGILLEKEEMTEGRRWWVRKEEWAKVRKKNQNRKWEWDIEEGQWVTPNWKLFFIRKKGGRGRDT